MSSGARRRQGEGARPGAAPQRFGSGLVGCPAFGVSGGGLTSNAGERFGRARRVWNGFVGDRVALAATLGLPLVRAGGCMLRRVANKRQHERRPLRLRGTAYGEACAELQCQTRDLSLGGAFLESGEQPAFGTELRLVLQLPDGAELELSTVVRWVSPDGFGVQFGLMGARSTQQLVTVLRGAKVPESGLEDV